MKTQSISTSIWYQALSLSERSALLGKNGEPPKGKIFNKDVAQKLFRRWQSEPQFEDTEILDKRLAADLLDQDSLYQILGLSTETLSQNSGDLEWLSWLTEGYSQPASAFANPPPGAEELQFLDLIQPLIDYACEELFLGIENIASSLPSLPFDIQTIEDILLMNLPGPLLLRLSRTLVLELNVSRLQGNLIGETPAERFEGFIENIRHREHAIAILSEYPVLARQIILCLNQWVDVNLEFLHHLSHDWQAIIKKFCNGDNPGNLVELSAGAGDTHRGGRSVMIAEFESGFRLVYKPKSLAVDRHFQELLIWINAKEFNPPLRTMKMLDCQSYGWVEFIEHQECMSQTEINRFYRRLGSYLGLLYAINASDFHLENLIACGEHPMLIDLETLFNPDFEPFESSDAAAAAAKDMLSSVLVVGMLPQRLWSQEEYSGIDISGLGGEGGQLSPDRVPLPDAQGTDEMRYIRQRLELSGEANRPIFKGSEISALDQIPEIIDGFEAIYNLLLDHKEELIADGGPLLQFTAAETRVLLRPTRTYDQLLFESFHPDVLSDGLLRDLLFDRLWLIVSERPYMARAIPSEQNDLRQGDIPVFTTQPSSLILWNAAGNPIDGILLEDGMSIAIKRIKHLSLRDRHRQEWFVHSSLASLVRHECGLQPTKTTRYQLNPSPVIFDQQSWFDGARVVAGELAKSAVHGEEDVTWIGLEHTEDGIWDLAPLGPSLYSGTAGIALFLGFAGTILEDKQYTSIARKSLIGILRHAEAFSSILTEIGAYQGWAGTLYTLTNLALLWEDQDLFEKADNLVSMISENLNEDNNLTIFDGAAGAISPLLAYYKVSSSSKALDTAVACGKHLLSSSSDLEEGIGWVVPKHGPRPILGLPHGTAGIASALNLLGEVSGNKELSTTAKRAFGYERSMFLAHNHQWPFIQQMAHNEESKIFPTTWCHGTVGAGLARLQVLRHIKGEYLIEEVDYALKTTLDRGFGFDHSLCHGDMGCLELLLVAHKTVEFPWIEEPLKQYGAAILENIKKDGWRCGGPMAVQMPGLMTGIAGIGYQMLRMANPDLVPSILLLDTISPHPSF